MLKLISILTLILLGSASLSAEPVKITLFRSLSYKECRGFLDQRPFRSREEFLQLFYEIYFTESVDDIVLRRAEIDSLADNIKTYFPLRECDHITFSGGILTLVFRRRQKVCIPGMFRQAFLHFTDKVVFNIYPRPRDPKILLFDIKEGEISISTTWLIRFFTPYPLDARATRLFYKADPITKTSYLGMEQILNIPGDQLVIRKKGDLVQVDARHPEAMKKVDMYFKPGELYYFGMTMKLLADGYVKCNNYDPEQKPAGHAWFTSVIDSVLAAPEKMLENGVIKKMSLTYYLEEKRGQFWQEFDFIKD